MAVTVSLSLVGTDLDKINVCLDGTFSGTLSSIDLVITNPDREEFTVTSFTPTSLANPSSLPAELVLTTTIADYTSTNFIDGAYRFDVTRAEPLY